jgi:hypothetical protein
MATYTNGQLRDRPRVNVTRGYAGNEPQALTKSAPVNSTATIKSGQPIALVSGEWVQATNAHNKQQIYIAYHDSDDTDVQSCGQLLGFSVLGEFEIESAWYDDTDASVVVGAALKVTSANVLASSGGDTIGYVTEVRDLGVAGHKAGNERGGVLGTIPEDSTANNLKIVKFVTSAA